jgi:predicted extracellular nuclease
MAQTTISFATFNLYNLNEPGLPLYKNSHPWTDAQYRKKIKFIAQTLNEMKSDVFGFQELWHEQSLKNALTEAGLANEYEALVPAGHAGGHIVCAAAVRKDILSSAPDWINSFPAIFKMSSGGDDAQTSAITVNIDSFSRPVLHFTVTPRNDAEPIHVYVCHFKSKGPTWISREPWYDRDTYSKHSEAIGAGISTIRRTAEATALRMMLTEQMKGTNTPVVVLGDCNDGVLSNTLNILTSQPRYLMGHSTGGGDTDLYTGQTLQDYRSTRDVYYTHVHQNNRESLDQILVSQEFYDNSRRRVWAFEDLVIANDHLNFEDHKEGGTNDHGIVRAQFKFDPVNA